MKANYEPVIGFEIHVELKTASKMFCGCKNDPFYAKHPNIYTCPVCLGLPGALPVPNRKAVEWTIMLGLALDCEIPEVSKFDRKHYFYPDLPKGYQISQYDQPIAINGSLAINYPIIQLSNNPIIQSKKIRIRRVHLEEDTGKLLHTTINGEKVTLVDFNRCGVPLVEIVTEPDVRSIEEVKIFLKKIHQIIRYLDISDADMEKGSMRIEPNVSVRKKENGKRKKDSSLPQYKVEVKNINSFRFAERAIKYEIDRQIAILEKGQTPGQETRGFDAEKGITVPQRGKEEAADYRYFPEPDIPPMRFAHTQISKLKSQIPELPDVKLERFQREYGLNAYDSGLIVETRELADYFEEAVKAGQAAKTGFTPKDIANWLINRSVDLEKVLPAQLVADIVRARDVATISEVELRAAIQQTLEANSNAVADYKKGKEAALMFLVGQVRRKLGNVDSRKVMEILKLFLSC